MFGWAKAIEVELEGQVILANVRQTWQGQEGDSSWGC